ncbi:unnamed protein product [Caretta caretta]
MLSYWHSTGGSWTCWTFHQLYLMKQELQRARVESYCERERSLHMPGDLQPQADELLQLSPVDSRPLLALPDVVTPNPMYRPYGEWALSAPPWLVGDCLASGTKAPMWGAPNSTSPHLWLQEVLSEPPQEELQ